MCARFLQKDFMRWINWRSCLQKLTDKKCGTNMKFFIISRQYTGKLTQSLPNAISYLHEEPSSRMIVSRHTGSRVRE